MPRRIAKANQLTDEPAFDGIAEKNDEFRFSFELFAQSFESLELFASFGADGRGIAVFANCAGSDGIDVGLVMTPVGTQLISDERMFLGQIGADDQRCFGCNKDRPWWPSCRFCHAAHQSEKPHHRFDDDQCSMCDRFCRTNFCKRKFSSFVV